MFRDEDKSCGLGREKLRERGLRSPETGRVEYKLSVSFSLTDSLTGLRRPKGMVDGMRQTAGRSGEVWCEAMIGF